MKVIRENIFETNSSSTHSISIKNTGIYRNDLKLDEFNKLKLGGQTFRPYLYDTYSKVNYLLQYFTEQLKEDFYDEEELEQIRNKIKLIKEVVAEELNINIDDIILDESGDLGDVGDAPYKPFERNKSDIYNKKRLRLYLFNSDSYLQVGSEE